MAGRRVNSRPGCSAMSGRMAGTLKVLVSDAHRRSQCMSCDGMGRRGHVGICGRLWALGRGRNLLKSMRYRKKK